MRPIRSTTRRSVRGVLARIAPLGIALSGTASAQYTQRVSVDSDGTQASWDSSAPSISADGRYVAFASRAALVAWDTNSKVDVYLRDRVDRTTTLVSVGVGGALANDASSSPSISADGRYVAFASSASNLVSGDTNGFADIFVRDLEAGVTTRVNLASSGGGSNGQSSAPSISADGRFVVFTSLARNLVIGDTNNVPDVFVRDRNLSATTRVSVDSFGIQGDTDSSNGTISADGRYVAFESYATNLVPGDTNGVEDVFVRDLVAGTTTRVSLAPGDVEGDGASQQPSISADGTRLAFLSWASNFVPGDTNGTVDLFVRDLVLGTTTRESVSSSGDQGNGQSVSLEISADGRFVAFASLAPNLVPGDTNGGTDAFVRDLVNGTTERVNLGPGGVQDDGRAQGVAISSDGAFVAFDSDGGTLVPNDTNHRTDVFVRDRVGGTNFTSLCEPGTGGVLACPCGNPPAGPGRGCDNSSSTGGASLVANGGTFLVEDTLLFVTAGERDSAASLLLQGNYSYAFGAVYGQGLRCISGGFRRLFVKTASSGSATFPDFGAGDPTISARTAEVGMPISAGESRWYLVTYRDPVVLGGCPATMTFNATQTAQIVWQP